MTAVLKKENILTFLGLLGVGVFLSAGNGPSAGGGFWMASSSSWPRRERSRGSAPGMTVLAEGLEVPWALAFLPGGDIIFTERPGRLRLLSASGRLVSEPLLTIKEVVHKGEGGLLGLAVHPDFSRNRLLYLYYTYQEGERVLNKVVRYKMNALSPPVEDEVILAGIPGAVYHNGGRIKFGPDRCLYITTGDALRPDLAQDKNSLAGKTLRLNDDGSVPRDNPFASSPVYSYGHRNPQGLAWDKAGRLWATEHGSSAADEVNLIEKGKNYGWPLVRGEEKKAGTTAPRLQSGRETWAPSGAAILGGTLYFAGLYSESLFRVDTGAEPLRPERALRGVLGRLREVAVGPDGFLYLATSNRDGRLSPAAGDDVLVKVDPLELSLKREALD